MKVIVRVLWNCTIKIKNEVEGSVKDLEKIEFRTDDGETVYFYVVEQTRINGMNYILVSDTEEGEGQALILKDLSEDGDEEGVYEIVDSDEELDAVGGVFANMLDDVDFI